MNNLFAELLQVSVGTRGRLSDLPTDSDWAEIQDLAKVHSLFGVLYAGIVKLPKDQVPDKVTLLKLFAQANYLKSLNQKVNDRCAALTRLFAQEGYRTCILKGQANAAYYPEPDVRTPGDIDVWVIPKNSLGLEKDRIAVANYVLSHQDDYLRMQYHHIDYHIFPDLEVEVHFCPTLLFSYPRNCALQKIFEDVKEACFQNYNKEHSFCVLTPLPNLLMQLVHMYRHVFDGGFGMKQILDFYYLIVNIRNQQGAKALSSFTSDIERIGMTRFCGGVCYVIDRLLLNGKDQELLLINPDQKHGEMLLSVLDKWTDKKLGKNATEKKKSQLGTFFGSIKRNANLWNFYPSDCAWNIVYRLSQYFWRKRHGWK